MAERITSWFQTIISGEYLGRKLLGTFEKKTERSVNAFRRVGWILLPTNTFEALGLENPEECDFFINRFCFHLARAIAPEGPEKSRINNEHNSFDRRIVNYLEKISNPGDDFHRAIDYAARNTLKIMLYHIEEKRLGYFFMRFVKDIYIKSYKAKEIELAKELLVDNRLSLLIPAEHNFTYTFERDKRSIDKFRTAVDITDNQTATV